MITRLLIGTTLLLAANNTLAAENYEMPSPYSCDQLGYRYTQSECAQYGHDTAGEYLICPFNQNKYYCNVSCTDQGYSTATPSCGQCSVVTCSSNSSYQKCGGLTGANSGEQGAVLVKSIPAYPSVGSGVFTPQKGASYITNNLCSSVRQYGEVWGVSNNGVLEQWFKNNGLVYTSSNFDPGIGVIIEIDPIYCQARNKAQEIMDDYTAYGSGSEYYDFVNYLETKYPNTDLTPEQYSVYITARIMERYDCTDSKIDFTILVGPTTDACKIELNKFNDDNCEPPTGT